MDKQDELYEITSNDSTHAHTLLQNCVNLFFKSELVDCTVVCKDGQLQAHKVILAASCTYMQELLKSTAFPTQCSHPMIFLRRWKVEDFRTVLQYMYTGKADILRSNFATILKICEELEYQDLARAVMKVTSKSKSGQKMAHSLNRGSGLSPSGTRKSSSRKSHSPETSNHVWPTVESESLHTENDHDMSTAWNNNDNIDSHVDDNFTRSNDASLTPSNSNSKMASPVCSIKNEIQSEEEDDDEDGPIVGEEEGEYDNPNIIQPHYPAFGERTNNINQRGVLKGNRNKRHIMEVDNIMEEDDQKNYGGSAAKIRMIASSTAVNNNGQLENYEDQDENESGEDENEDEGELISLVNPEDLLEVKHDFREEDNNGESQSQCPWCSETFTNVVLLQRHLRTHVNKYRPYSCEYCQNSFARSAHLKRHLRVHTGEKPYVCKVCGRAFARQDKLKGHSERHLQQASRTEIPSSNDAMTITSFSPQVTQIPIKVLVPNGMKVGRSKLPNQNSVKQSLDSLLMGNSFRSNNTTNGNRFEIGSTTSNGLSISLASSNFSDSRQKSNSSGGLTVTPAARPSSTYIQSLTSRGAGTMFTGGDLGIKREHKLVKHTNYYNNNN